MILNFFLNDPILSSTLEAHNNHVCLNGEEANPLEWISSKIVRNPVAKRKEGKTKEKLSSS